MRRNLTLCLFVGVLIWSGISHAQEWVGILAPQRATVWNQAGVSGGIPNRSTICASLTAGATAAQINSAITACPSGQVVQLGPGTYSLATGLVLKGNVTLRGAGADKTLLTMHGTDSCRGLRASICLAGTGTWWGDNLTPVNWTTGYTKGTTQITVASTSGLAVGTILVLDQLDDPSDTGQTVISDLMPTFSRQGGAAGRLDRAQQEYFQIVAINGNVLTITPGLRMPNWSAARAPQAYTYGGNIYKAGVEDLSVDHGPANAGIGGSGIAFHNATDCWIRGVRSLNGSRNHVWLRQAFGAEVRDSYFYGGQGAGSQSYGVESFLANDALVLNNIFHHVTAPLMIGNNIGSVYAFNYTIDNHYEAPAWLLAAFLVHDAGVGMLLLEGNYAQSLQADLFHGTSTMVTTFRNFFAGWEPGKSSNTIPIQVQSWHRYYNHVGDILGTPGYHKTYQSVSPTGTNGNTAIFTLGWGGQAGRRLSDDPPNDPRVVATTLRWGNYDVVSGAVRFDTSEVPSGDAYYPNPVPASHTLPASFFLPSKPSWWGDRPWPAIGPDVTGGTGPGGHVHSIPAKDCFDRTPQTSGILNFNAVACYGPLLNTEPPRAPRLLGVR